MNDLKRLAMRAYLDGQRDVLLTLREAFVDVSPRAYREALMAVLDAMLQEIEAVKHDPNRLIPKPEEHPYVGEAGC